MSQNDVFQKVLQIVKPFVKNQEAFANATDATRFIDDLKINSARLVDIVLAFEDEFHFPISDEEAEEIQTVGAAVKLITEKAGK